MKKLFLFSILILSLALVFSGCDKGSDSDDSAHKHSVKELTVDLNGHEKLCQCGETFGKGNHTLEDSICTDCGAEVYVFDDGTSSVAVYDKNGYCVLCLFYDENGTLETKEETIITYNEDGRPISDKCYTNSELSAESFYSISKDGYSYIQKAIFYWEDGSRMEYTYDEHWNDLSCTSYAEDGETILYQYVFEYEYTEDGLYTAQTAYLDDVLLYESFYVIRDSEWGPMPVMSEHFYYYEDGTMDHEQYDENGNMISSSKYDENGNLIDVTYYDEDGNIIG